MSISSWMLDQEVEAAQRRELRLFSPCFKIGKASADRVDSLADLEAVLKRRGIGFKVLVINDELDAETHDTLEECKRKYAFLELKHNERNMGNAHNIVVGYTWATTDATEQTAIACSDFDGEHHFLDLIYDLIDLEKGMVDGIVGSPVYPTHMIMKEPKPESLEEMADADWYMMRHLGIEQANALQLVTGTLYLHSPGYQLHRGPTFIRKALEALPGFMKAFEAEHRYTPRWGMHFILDRLMVAAGARIKGVHLRCYGAPPNRDPKKRMAQTHAAIDALGFFQKLFGR